MDKNKIIFNTPIKVTEQEARYYSCLEGATVTGDQFSTHVIVPSSSLPQVLILSKNEVKT